MGGCFFYMCKLFFFVGQAISLYIILTFTLVTLPTSEPTKNKTLNYLLIGINYIFHFFAAGLHQYSYWKVAFSDAGYFGDMYKTVRIGEVEPAEPVAATGQDAENAVVPPKKIKYEIYIKKDFEAHAVSLAKAEM